jgi:small subunit ribosomal protein S2
MPIQTTFNDLLESGSHFGHLKSKWNPAMAPYIYAEKNGIHIIDLNKTLVKMEEAANALKQIVRSGRKVLFVATKKQAKDIVAEKVRSVNMPFVTERWPGGMLTNFATIRKSVRRMGQIDKMFSDGTFSNVSKRERLQFTRERAKLENQFGSIAELTRLPAALFIVDIMKEHIAVAEARRLNIPTFAIVDTNSNPGLVDFVIPANDDASTSITLIVESMVNAIREGLSDRRMDKEAQADENENREHAGEGDENGSETGGREEFEDEEKSGAKRRRRVVAKR